MTFFPVPGCVAGNVVFSRGAARLATARRLKFEGSWASMLLLRRHLKTLRAEGLDVHLPKNVPPPVQDSTQKQDNVVDELIADGTVLQIDTGGHFEFPRLRLNNVSKKEEIRFAVTSRVPLLSGLVNARGTLGPWDAGNGARTPLSASFEFAEGDLSRYQDVAGILSAKGTLSGGLGAVAVHGESDIPNFEVKHNGNVIRLRTKFDGLVDGTTGVVHIRGIAAHFLGSSLLVTGSVRDGTAALDFTSQTTRVQDLLKIFTRAKPPAVYGPIQLRAHVSVPDSDAPFLRRLRLQGRFEIDRAAFGKARTQAKVNELSSRARGEDLDDNAVPDRVGAHLRGDVDMRDGVAHLSNVIFGVPGATAHGNGVFNVLTKRVDLHGTVAMEATVSEASSGFKSIVLKPFNFLFKKKNAGAVLPVSVTGAYPRPVVRVSVRPTG